MQTIFCVYQTEELYPRFVRASAQPDQAWEAILARALDGEDDDIAAWCHGQIQGGHQPARYDLQSGVDEDQVSFFVEYWETIFAQYVSDVDSMSEDARSAVDGVIAALRRDASSED